MSDLSENKKLMKRYSIGEEIFNSVTHGVGAGLSIAAIVLLSVRAYFNAPEGRTGITVTSFVIFGSSMFILYIMSTLYHALTPYGAKNVFQIFDHSSIYLLIAGTYTPYCLVGLQGARGWAIFGVIWGLSVFGITMYSVFGNQLRVLSSITYVIMGWMIVFQFPTLYERLPRISFIMLIISGLCYTAGVPFYALKKCKWFHCVWHLWVIAGSVIQFFSIMFMI